MGLAGETEKASRKRGFRQPARLLLLPQLMGSCAAGRVSRQWLEGTFASLAGVVGSGDSNAAGNWTEG